MEEINRIDRRYSSGLGDVIFRAGWKFVSAQKVVFTLGIRKLAGRKNVKM